MEKLEATILTPPFAWDSFDAYLFDIDGTLLNSRDGVHYNPFIARFRQVWNCELKIDGVPLHGNTDIGILRAAASAAGVSAEEFSRKLPRAIATMQAEVERNVALLRTELCPSVSELLQRLHSAGKLLARDLRQSGADRMGEAARGRHRRFLSLRIILRGSGRPRRDGHRQRDPRRYLPAWHRRSPAAPGGEGQCVLHWRYARRHPCSPLRERPRDRRGHWNFRRGDPAARTTRSLPAGLRRAAGVRCDHNFPTHPHDYLASRAGRCSPQPADRLQSRGCAVSGLCCCLPLCCPHTDSSPRLRPNPRNHSAHRNPGIVSSARACEPCDHGSRALAGERSSFACQLCAPTRRTRSFPSAQRRKSGGGRPGNFTKPSSCRNDHGCGRLSRHFETAAALAPDNLEYLTAREVARQKLVFEDVQAGNQAMAAGNNYRGSRPLSRGASV